MDERETRRLTLGERASRALALPGEGLAGLPRLELIGDGELYLENYRDILSYSPEEVCVEGKGWLLRLTGRGLEIRAMGPGELRLLGRVDRLELV